MIIFAAVIQKVSSNNYSVKIIMEINNIGNNAGVVWNVLNANGKMTETKLKKESGLGSAEFYTALGWLAREGKLNVVRVIILHGND